MAINKRKSKNGIKYQVKVKASDGYWETKTFASKKDAKEYELRLKLQNQERRKSCTFRKRFSVEEFFKHWFSETESTISKGWRITQLQMYKSYIFPIIGKMRLQDVRPIDINKVLEYAASLKRGPQTRLHIYNFMHRAFGDAADSYGLLFKNPVARRFKPFVPSKEADHLNIIELKSLLLACADETFGLAVWIQAFLGLRVSEVQALKWDDINLEQGLLYIRRSYSRKSKEFQPYTKARKQLAFKMPPELWTKLEQINSGVGKGFVIISPNTGDFMCYHSYEYALKLYCKKAGIKTISTHGLRHSASELYQAHGGSRDDLRILYGHSSNAMTDRYVHDKGQKLEKVANEIRLFDKDVSQKVSQWVERGNIVQLTKFREERRKALND